MAKKSSPFIRKNHTKKVNKDTKKIYISNSTKRKADMKNMSTRMLSELINVKLTKHFILEKYELFYASIGVNLSFELDKMRLDSLTEEEFCKKLYLFKNSHYSFNL